MSMSSTNIKINTVKLSSEISKLRDTKKTLEELSEIIKKDNNLLKDLWESRTSESVFESFEDFYKKYEAAVKNIDDDIKFLENKVNQSYTEKDEHTSTQIDDKIAL